MLSWRLVAALLCALSWSACVHVIRPDPAPAASSAHYPSAELLVNGEVQVGLATVIIHQGELLSTAKLAVRGYFSGTVRIDSQRCGLSGAAQYVDNQVVPIYLPPLPAMHSCLVDVSVFPQWPYERESGVALSDLKGQFLLKVVPAGETAYAATERVRAGADAELLLPSRSDAPARVVFRGCGATFDESRPVTGGTIRVALSELGNRAAAGAGTCSYEGFFRQDGQVHHVSWLIWSYDAGFAPLAAPALRVSAGQGADAEVQVTADPATAVIMLDNQYVVDNTAHFSFNKGESHTLRTLTVKGRSAVCVWSKETPQWTCLN